MVREPNSENCLDSIFVSPPREKVVILPDTNCITFAIRKFMLDMPSVDGFQNIGLLIWTQHGSEFLKPCGSNWVKIKGDQSKISLHSPIVHWMLIKNGKRTVMIWCILTELLECKVHEECLCLPVSTFLELWVAITLSWSIRSRTPWFFDNFRSALDALLVCVSWFLMSFFNFYLKTRSEPSWPQV